MATGDLLPGLYGRHCLADPLAAPSEQTEFQNLMIEHTVAYFVMRSTLSRITPDHPALYPNRLLFHIRCWRYLAANGGDRMCAIG